jgi:hypothetical protein
MLDYSMFITGNFILVDCVWITNIPPCLGSLIQGDDLMAWKYCLDARNKKPLQIYGGGKISLLNNSIKEWGAERRITPKWILGKKNVKMLV